MPHISVKLWPGKSKQQKVELAQQIVKDVMNILGSSEDSISVAIEEVASEVWSEQVYKPEIVGKSDTLFKKPGYKM